MEACECFSINKIFILSWQNKRRSPVRTPGKKKFYGGGFAKRANKDCCDSNGHPNPDVFDMAVFAWKEDYKSMKSRMDKYKGNKSNALALIYDQCSTELKNKLK